MTTTQSPQPLASEVRWARLVDSAIFTHTVEGETVTTRLPANTLVLVPASDIASRICRPTMHGGGIHVSRASFVDTGARAENCIVRV